MGVKFFLHPIATEEAIKCVREGMTKVELSRHQYFVSLEVYAFDPAAEHVAEASVGLPPPRVNEGMVRSTIFLVATGNPDHGHRDWVLSIVNAEQHERIDPLDRFRSGTEAALKVL